VALVVCLAWPSAAAAITGESEVDEHATLGRQFAEGARYHDAISEYRKAYELKADPEFLFAIAGAYRHLGNVDRALFFYQRYVTTAPDGANRALADQAIAELGPPVPAPAPPPAPSLTHDLIVVPVPAAEKPRVERPLWRRWWIWAALGAVVVGATVTAMARRNDSEPPAPPTALGNMRY